MLWRKSSASSESTYWRQSEIEKRRRDALKAVQAASQAGRHAQLGTLIDRALFLDDLDAAVTPVAQVAPPINESQFVSAASTSSTVAIYQAGTLFLKECLDYLLENARGVGPADDAESVALISGTKVGAIRTWDRLVRTPLAYSSHVGAVIDNAALSTGLRNLDSFGYALYGVIHVHLHQGPPRPSSTDLALSKKLEEGGYPVIQAVFSESGHIRFFSDQREFEVMIYGTGIEKLDHRLYRLAPQVRITNRR